MFPFVADYETIFPRVFPDKLQRDALPGIPADRWNATIAALLTISERAEADVCSEFAVRGVLVVFGSGDGTRVTRTRAPRRDSR